MVFTSSHFSSDYSPPLQTEYHTPQLRTQTAELAQFTAFCMRAVLSDFTITMMLVVSHKSSKKVPFFLTSHFSALLTESTLLFLCARLSSTTHTAGVPCRSKLLIYKTEPPLWLPVNMLGVNAFFSMMWAVAGWSKGPSAPSEPHGAICSPSLGYFSVVLGPLGHQTFPLALWASQARFPIRRAGNPAKAHRQHVGTLLQANHCMHMCL